MPTLLNSSCPAHRKCIHYNLNIWFCHDGFHRFHLCCEWKRKRNSLQSTCRWSTFYGFILTFVSFVSHLLSRKLVGHPECTRFSNWLTCQNSLATKGNPWVYTPHRIAQITWRDTAFIIHTPNNMILAHTHTAHSPTSPRTRNYWTHFYLKFSFSLKWTRRWSGIKCMHKTNEHTHTVWRIYITCHKHTQHTQSACILITYVM